jgi:TolA-binding protein
LEQKSEWPGALDLYEKWLERFPTNGLRPQAEFYRALANFRSGNSTNAFTLFTNFVSRFPTNELAPMAQWWVADYHYRQGEFEPAEKSFKLLFQNWPASPLAYQARMMAGRAAVGRNDYPAAIEHFSGLPSDTNCPPDLRTEALLAYGSAQMRLDTGETNRVKNLQDAIEVFETVHQKNPASESAARAWGAIGKCYLQLAANDPRHYSSASNAFQQIVGSPHASFDLRCQAKVGLGGVAESQAAQKVGADRVVLLKQALDHYLDAFFYEKLLRDGEQPDWTWVRYAGLEAARVAELLEQWPQALNVYRSLQKLLPALHATLEKKISRAQERLASGKY